ncbi:unnamed protein product [Fusarium graminearum]|nr:unnamed protein product [Fusarium graminearum]
MAPRLSDADHEMMKAMIQNGGPTKQIAQSIPCDPRTGRKAKARYRLFESTKAPPNRVGRYKKVTPYKQDVLLENLDQYPTTDRTQMVTFLHDEFEDDVSVHHQSFVEGCPMDAKELPSCRAATEPRAPGSIPL